MVSTNNEDKVERELDESKMMKKSTDGRKTPQMGKKGKRTRSNEKKSGGGKMKANE